MIPSPRRARGETDRWTAAGLRRLAPVQRDAVIERILGADHELRPWLPEIVAIYQRKAARRLPPLSPDSVSD